MGWKAGLTTSVKFQQVDILWATNLVTICVFTPYFEIIIHSIQDGLWVRFYDNNTQMEAWLVPQVYLNCTAEVTHFPSCEVQFDHPDAQCAEGRKG